MRKYRCCEGRAHQRRVALEKAKRLSKRHRKHKKFERIADAMENSVVLAVTRGFAIFKRRIDADMLERLFTEGRFEEAIETIPWGKLPGDLERLPEALEPAALAGSRFALETLPRPAPGLIIGPGNPALRRYIDSQIGNMVVGATVEAQQAIRFAVSESFRQGLTPKRAALMIRDSIGITEKQHIRIMRARQSQVARRESLERRLALLKSKGQERSKSAQNIRIQMRTLTEKNLDLQVQRKISNAQKNRSIAIARTEITDAMNEGQELVWGEASDRGLIDRQSAKKIWTTIPDADRTDICAGLEGQAVPIDGEFYSEVTGQSYRHPPAHPNCRSSVILEA